MSTALAAPPAAAAGRRAVMVEAIAAHWWSALDAADAAVDEAAPVFERHEVHELHARLVAERSETAALLADVARR